MTHLIKNYYLRKSRNKLVYRAKLTCWVLSCLISFTFSFGADKRTLTNIVTSDFPRDKYASVKAASSIGEAFTDSPAVSIAPTDSKSLSVRDLHKSDSLDISFDDKLIFGGLITVIFLILLIWNMKLRYKIKQQLKQALSSEEKRNLTFEVLKQSQENYEKLINSIDDMVVSIDRYARYLFTNNKTLELLGLNKREAIGKQSFDFIHPDDREKTENWFLKKINDGKRYGTIENRYISKNGDELIFNWNYIFYYGDDEQIERIDGIGRDVTAQKKLEAEQIFISTVLDNLPGAFYLYNKDGKLLRWNKEVTRLSGFTYNELSSWQLFDWFKGYPDEIKKIQRTVDKAYKYGRSEIVSFIISKDGEKIPMHFIAKSLVMNGENYFLGAGIDLRERIKAETEIKELRNYLSSIINSMPSALIGVNPDNIITQWNYRAEQLSGISAHKAIGLNLVEALPRLKKLTKNIKYTIESNKPVVITNQKYKHENVVKYDDITIYPLEKNSFQGAVIRIDDATEKVKLESIMVQTEKMTSVAGLTAGMAHEINNPLAAISQGIQNITRRLDPAIEKNIEASKPYNIDLEQLQKFLNERRILEFLDGARNAVKRAAIIVKNMLMFSRRSDSNISEINLQQLVEHAITLGATDYDMKKKFDFKFVDIVREFDADLPLVRGYANELEQVLLNLFKNALQAMEDIKDDNYKPQFHIRLKNKITFVRIEVEDNGPGIPEERQPRIFEPFFTTKPVGEGTGLGLSVSYMIITQNHKGTFEVESEVGQGAKFIIELPV